MAKILYSARFVLPITAPPIEDGAVLVESGRIRAVGRRAELAVAHPGARAVEFGDAVLLPPLANAHTHLELTGYPSWCGAWQDKPERGSFVGWIRHLIRVKSNLPRDSYAAAIQAGIRACLSSGCGAVGDVLSSHFARAAYRGSPLLGRVYFELLGQDPAVARQQLDILDDVFGEAPFGRLEAGLSPHSPYTLAPAVLDELLAHAGRRHWPVSLHLAESPEEVAFLTAAKGAIAEQLYPYVGWQDRLPKAAGLRPVPYLMSRAPLPQSLLLAHGVQVSAEEVAQVKASGASVVLCPRSNAQLGVGKAPVVAYRRAGVPLALGTDSLASAPTLSIWDELAFAREWFADAMPAADWLAVATLGGARALGLDGEMGSLAADWPASFQVVATPAGAGPADLADALCAGGRQTRVVALYIAGENVLPNGRTNPIMTDPLG